MMKNKKALVYGLVSGMVYGGVLLCAALLLIRFSAALPALLPLRDADAAYAAQVLAQLRSAAVALPVIPVFLACVPTGAALFLLSRRFSKTACALAIAAFLPLLLVTLCFTQVNEVRVLNLLFTFLPYLPYL